MEETKPVEAKDETIAGTHEEKVETTEPDLLDMFQEVIKQNEKLTSERDNYKKVALAKKRGETVEEISQDEVERRAEERAAEILREQRQKEFDDKQREIALKALKENRELKAALKGKAAVVNSPSSASSAGSEVKTNDFFSPEQLAYFKKRNIDPAKVLENYKKSR